MEALTYAGATRQFACFARESGISVESMLDAELKTVLAASAVADRLPAHAIVDMLDLCSIATGRADLGAAVAAWARISGGFGPLSLAWQYSPTFGETVRINERFIHIENRAVAIHVVEEHDQCALQHTLRVPTRFGGSQFIEASLALDLRMARMVLGDEHWSPVRLELSHPAPSDTRTQRALFRCPIEFGADRNALVFRRGDLVRPAPQANAQMFAFFERHFEQSSASQAESAALTRRVSDLIAAKLSSGMASLEHIASAMAMSPRTLQRKLADQEASFAGLLADVRKSTTEEYFRARPTANLTELAYKLGYSDNSAASRYLRTYLHTGARAIRMRNDGAVKATGYMN